MCWSEIERPLPEKAGSQDGRARSEGREHLAKAAAGRLQDHMFPGWGNAAMGAYDAWDTYKYSFSMRRTGTKTCPKLSKSETFS